MASALTSEMRHRVSGKEGPSQVPSQRGERGPGPSTQPRASQRCGCGSRQPWGRPVGAQPGNEAATLQPPGAELLPRGGRSPRPQAPLGTSQTKAATRDGAPANSNLGFLSTLFIFPPGRPLPGAWSQPVGEGGERTPRPRVLGENSLLFCTLPRRRPQGCRPFFINHSVPVERSTEHDRCEAVLPTQRNGASCRGYFSKEIPS